MPMKRKPKARQPRLARHASLPPGWPTSIHGLLTAPIQGQTKLGAVLASASARDRSRSRHSASLTDVADTSTFPGKHLKFLGGKWLPEQPRVLYPKLCKIQILHAMDPKLCTLTRQGACIIVS